MPGDKNFTEISIRSDFRKQYEKRVKVFKKKLPEKEINNRGRASRQLEFDLEMLGAIEKKDKPTPPSVFIPILKDRIAELEKAESPKV